MYMEYQHGVRITKYAHELPCLEAIFKEYEDNLSKQRNLIKNAPTPELEKTSSTYKTRKKLQDEALEHLEKERMSLESMADVQAQLITYRAAGEKIFSENQAESEAALRKMSTEKHHPASALEKYMRAEGVPKPSPYHTAHHIVPGKGKEAVLTARTRLHIHRNGIRINDPANGVYLVRKDDHTPHWSMPDSKGHLRYHTKEYERYLAARITRLQGMNALKTQLQVIGRLLQQHEPKYAIQQVRNAR